MGQFLYVQQIVSRALSTANSLVSSLSSIDEDLANLKDYELFMALPVHSDHAPPLLQAPGTVELRDIRFTYTGSDLEVIRGISLTIREGQHIAIVGENGAGKSTLIRILAGLYRPDSGQVLLDGVDLAAVDVKSWHRHLAVLSQEFLKYEFATAAENIFFGDVESPRDDVRIRRAAANAEALEFINKLPNGLDNYVSNWMEDPRGRKGSGLSGGQWQRLAMARNFYRNARFMVMDEPTSAIDALAEHRIFTRLFADRSSTIIAISHRLATIEKADVVYMLEDGRMVNRAPTRSWWPSAGATSGCSNPSSPWTRPRASPRAQTSAGSLPASRSAARGTCPPRARPSGHSAAMPTRGRKKWACPPGKGGHARFLEGADGSRRRALSGPGCGQMPGQGRGQVKWARDLRD